MPAAVALIAVALGAFEGCGGSGSESTTAISHRGEAQKAPGGARTRSKPKAPEPPARRCGAPRAAAEVVRFRASDGTDLEGASIGTGDVGVVFVHEYPGPPEGPYCGFWPYAVKLAHGGIRSLLFNLRCFGDSACPPGSRQARPVADVEGALREIQRLGSSRVVLVGASLGGTVVIKAAAAIRPPVAGVVDLSGELDLGELLGGRSELDAGAAAPRVVSPALLAVARNDRYTPISDMRTLYARLDTQNKRVIVEPLQFGHGWLMLDGPPLSWSPLARRIEAFIRQR